MDCEEYEDFHPGSKMKKEQEEKLTKELQDIVDEIGKTLKDPNDPTQTNFIKALQKHRRMILDVSSKAFILKPNNPKLLDAINSVLTAMEKSVRDDRKEKFKKDESEQNKITLRQMVEGLNKLRLGEIKLPSFGIDNFIMDNTKSLTEVDPDMKKINPEELVTGMQILDFDGNVVKD